MSDLVVWIVLALSLLMIIGDFAWSIRKTIKSQRCSLCHHLKLLHVGEHGCIAEDVPGCACEARIKEMV